MESFQILCVTMNQKDFSKIDEMNIRSDVVFANQADDTCYKELLYDDIHTAQMITTQTTGVGINRNLALMYAKGDICLFADDDIRYDDDVSDTVLREFEAHPDADIFIFHLRSDDELRKMKSYPKTQKCPPIMRRPWGGARIAFRLESVRKANLWFSTLFGGGCLFPCGEDAKWLYDARKRGLTFYVSKETIGSISFSQSSWFTGTDSKFFFAKGAQLQDHHGKTIWVRMLYFALRTKKMTELSFGDRIKWMQHGRKGFKMMLSYEKYVSLIKETNLVKS